MSSHAELVKPAATPIPFSYAQAARGGTSNPASAQSSKTPSGAITPAKEQTAAPSLKSELNGAKWADSVDDDLKETSHSSASTAVDTQSTSSVKSPVTHAVHQVNGVGSPSGVDFGSSSPTTLVREDGTSPLVEMPESAWESKSQSASTAKGDNSRSRSSGERASSRGRKKSGKKSEKKEKTDAEAIASKTTWIPPPVKYVDAPAPSVNIWQLRAQQTKPPVAPKPTAASNPAPAPALPSKITPPVEQPKPVALANTPPAAVTTASTLPKESPAEATARGQQVEEKESSNKSTQQSTKASAKSEQPPKVTAPVVDQEAWPTPETAQVDEPRKKPLEKSESDVQATSAPKGKHAWEKVEFTPSVVFNTPLPGQARRGGKGSGRGGREGQARTSGAGQSEKRGDSSAGAPNGDTARRDRSEAARSTSPVRAKRAPNDENPARRSSRQESLTRDGSAKPTDESKFKPAENTEQATSRQSSIHKSKANRKEHVLVNGERRKDEAVAGKENDVPAEGKGTKVDPVAQTSGSAPSEVKKQETSPANTERKGSVTAEFSSRNHERKSSGSYSSYPGRARPDRGRGGHRGGRGNGHTFHQNAHPFSPGQSSAFAMQGYNNMPKSPTSFGQDPFFGQSPQHNQRYSRNFQSRASSIPTEGSYPRAPNGYSSQPLQINTGAQGNGIYPPDYYMPATAVPYQNDPTSNLINAVATQMEYYFSVDNLLKDMYLRKHMDSQGFVLLTFIAEFKRLKSMTSDLELIKYVCQQSPNIEHRIGSDDVDRLRATKGWDNWVLPMADRDQTAQNDGPESLHQPPHPHPQLPDQPPVLRHSSLPIPQSAGPVLGGQGFQSLNSFAAPYSYVPNTSADAPAPAQFQTSPTTLTSGQSVVPPSATSFGGAPVQSQFLHAPIEETEPDSFTDAEVDVLRVVVRALDPADTGSSSGGASHRTFSNGSADGVRVATSTSGTSSAAAPNDSERATSPASSERVNRFLSSSNRLASPRNGSRNGASQEAVTDVPGVYWIKDKDSPAHEMPPETTSDLYLAARDRALQQRNFHPCPYDMNVMYQFWEHFLVRNFNARMYMEFRNFAMDDASTRNEFHGLNSLLKYYGKALSHEVPIRRSVAHDYVNLVRSEPRESDRPAFKQLRAAWRDGALNMKNRKRVKDFLDKPMEEELDR